MSEIDLERLRTLRRRAETLLQTLVPDLKPFRHADPRSGFLRTPMSESIPGDANVTTSCSCLMALALTGKLGDFYEEDLKTDSEVVPATFKTLLSAPWMSSGLAENNAFTTTLIIRTLGFLIETEAVTPATVASTKFWEPQIDIRAVGAMASKLVTQSDPLSKVLYALIPKATQTVLEQFVRSGGNEADVKKTIRNELSRIVRTTALYDEPRFDAALLSDRTRAAVAASADAYTTAHLNRLLLDESYATELAPIEAMTLRQIAEAISSNPDFFRINDYAPATAVVYWFVDGVSRAQIKLPADNWKRLCEWAALEFAQQRSLVVAKHASMMDPVAMAMAACLCARLRSISKRSDLGASSSLQSLLPSTVELEESILELFREQTDSGIWPKYFPLFHYQEAGSNFCFTFELLEAVLTEFSDKDNRLVKADSFISGLELAVTWCERNRMKFLKAAGDGTLFTGWNSGGLLGSLRKEQPESWATAVVHMFLWELVDVLSRHIRERVLDRYRAAEPTVDSPTLKDILEVQVWLDKQHRSLTEILSETLVQSFKGVPNKTLRTRPPKKRQVSALLFGPPGTSKTQVAKALAAELSWPLVQIDPSHFLRSSFQNIYLQAETIFEDVKDLFGAVVLFDELDALVQKRDQGVAVDTEAKFLTTYMLPKLATLHDRGRIVFLMATNFQETFDDAIKRAGRFDLLLCMGPPTLKAKCDAVHVFYGMKQPSDATKRAGVVMAGFCDKHPWLQQQLELYTFGEFKSLLTGIGDKATIATELEKLGDAGFLNRVQTDSATSTLRFDDANSILEKYEVSTVPDLDPCDVDFKGVVLDKPVLRYLRDRRQSRRQA